MMFAEAATVWIAFIAFLGLIAVPLVNGHIARNQKREDWKREDEVRKTLAANTASVVALGEQTNTQLVTLQQGNDRIHALVNSTLTEAMEATVAAYIIALEALHSVPDPSPVQVARIEELVEKIANAQLALRDRAQAQSIADQV